jgi:MoxR-like ATPase
MKKLVNESLNEFLLANGEEPINEGRMGDFLKKAKTAVSDMFKKIGNFFVSFYQNKIVPAIAPINIGILVKGKALKNVGYVPSDEDVQLEPALASLKGGKAMIDRARTEYQQLAAQNKANGGLKKFESAFAEWIEALNEEQIKLPYSGEDEVRNVNAEFLVKRILLQMHKPTLMPPLIWGAPGIGKTAITKAVIRTLGPGHRCIDVQTSKMSPDDWTLPRIGNKMFVDSGGNEVSLAEAQDIPKNWLPVYLPSSDPEENARRDDVANQGNGGIIFLDELLRAADEVQNTCLKLVDERIVGDHKLGSKWAIVAASNRTKDDPDKQTEMGSALANRFQHWNFVPTVDEWIEWAKGAKVDPRIVDFVDFNRDHFYLFDNEQKLNTTPRSWEALSKMLAECQNYGDIVWTRADLETIVAGTVSSKTVEAFMAFLVLIEKWTPKQIMMLFTDPKKAPKPNKKGNGWDMVQVKALMGAACSATKDRELKPIELENYITYFIDLGNAALSSQALYLIYETHRDIGLNTGDIKDGKHDKYKKAMDMFRKEYGDIKFSKREDIMGAV